MIGVGERPSEQDEAGGQLPGEIHGRKCLGEGPSPVINLIFQNFDAPAVLPESFQRQIHAPPDQPQCFRVPDVQPWS